MAKTGLRCALDTNFLLDLAAKDVSAIAIHKSLVDNHSELIITNTVRAELENLARKKGHKGQALALIAFDNILTWQINPIQISPLHKGYIETFRDCLIKDKIIDEREKHDGEIIGEASFANADFLITSDEEMIKAESSVLTFHLKKQHMHAVSLVSKRIFSGLLQRKVRR